MKIKRLVSIGLAICLTLAFSTNVLAAEQNGKPANDTVITETTDPIITPNFASLHPVLYGYTGQAWVTAEPTLYVRSEPDNSSTAVDLLWYGDSVIVSSTTTNNWAYIGNGYCSGYYLTTVLGDIL